MFAPNPRAGLVAGKLMFPGEVGGKLMLSEGRTALPGPMRMGVSTSCDAMPVSRQTLALQTEHTFCGTSILTSSGCAGALFGRRTSNTGRTSGAWHFLREDIYLTRASWAKTVAVVKQKTMRWERPAKNWRENNCCSVEEYQWVSWAVLKI